MPFNLHLWNISEKSIPTFHLQSVFTPNTNEKLNFHWLKPHLQVVKLKLQLGGGCFGHFLITLSTPNPSENRREDVSARVLHTSTPQQNHCDTVSSQDIALDHGLAVLQLLAPM